MTLRPCSGHLRAPDHGIGLEWAKDDPVTYWEGALQLFLYKVFKNR